MRLALDPGMTTGVAWRSKDEVGCPHMSDYRGGPCLNCDGNTIRSTQWPGEAINVVLDGFHKSEGITEIVVENFRSIPRGPAVNLSASETIGRILAWADQYGIDVVRQDASPVKRVVTKDRLRMAGGWKRGEEHSRDAARHLLYREDKLGLIDVRQWEKGT